ncbi:hypothetical protein CJP74_00635 [Psittacicella melopsittaci]|uniref:Uncharacterized protein n=1 Tax=Psittacicella melopsittaci TaxID=2028576 RepID=A0A3A1YCP1_9GAMM|nr:hypothetical protein [Psittacicella melopsittaci]RIY33897.1 hypothetical protein CJP74_00635 [Psittacicella melopsittaci]
MSTLTLVALTVAVPLVALIVTPLLPVMFEFSIVVFSAAVMLTVALTAVTFEPVTLIEPFAEVMLMLEPSAEVTLVPLPILTPWSPAIVTLLVF